MRKKTNNNLNNSNDNLNDSDDNNIQLGGFPPIFYLDNENKKKREYKRKINEDIDNEKIDKNKLNILNIKNILKT